MVSLARLQRSTVRSRDCSRASYRDEASKQPGWTQGTLPTGDPEAAEALARTSAAFGLPLPIARWRHGKQPSVHSGGRPSLSRASAEPPLHPSVANAARRAHRSRRETSIALLARQMARGRGQGSARTPRPSPAAPTHPPARCVAPTTGSHPKAAPPPSTASSAPSASLDRSAGGRLCPPWPRWVARPSTGTPPPR